MSRSLIDPRQILTGSVNGKKLAVVGGALAAISLLPLLVSGYWLRIATTILMYATMTQALNIIAGYAGMAALGNIVFFGVGAYVTAVSMTRFHLPFFAALPMAGILAALLAAVVGMPIFKLKGPYFVMGTTGFAFFTREVVLNMDSLGGARGISLPLPSLGPSQSGMFFYFTMLGICLLCMLCVWRIDRSEFGLALRAIKANEEAAKVSGVSPLRYKILAWSLSGFFTALAGGASAYWNSFIEPASVFDLMISIKFFVMLLLGGPATLWGPVLGTVIIELLGDFAWGSFAEIHLLVLGVLIIIVTLVLPRGIVVYIEEKARSPNLAKMLGFLPRLRKGRV